jgi:hypothetical protein
MGDQYGTGALVPQTVTVVGNHRINIQGCYQFFEFQVFAVNIEKQAGCLKQYLNPRGDSFTVMNPVSPEVDKLGAGKFEAEQLKLMAIGCDHRQGAGFHQTPDYRDAAGGMAKAPVERTNKYTGLPLAHFRFLCKYNKPEPYSRNPAVIPCKYLKCMAGAELWPRSSAQAGY